MDSTPLKIFTDVEYGTAPLAEAEEVPVQVSANVPLNGVPSALLTVSLMMLMPVWATTALPSNEEVTVRFRRRCPNLVKCVPR